MKRLAIDTNALIDLLEKDVAQLVFLTKGKMDKVRSNIHCVRLGICQIVAKLNGLAVGDIKSPVIGIALLYTVSIINRTGSNLTICVVT